MNKKWSVILTDDEKRKDLQYVSIFLLFCFVSAFMTVLNVITHKGILTVSTAAFSVLCLINYLLVRKGGRSGTYIASILFSIEMVLLFTFFLISGNPDGFSALWIAMLPACGMLLFGRKRAAILSGIMFIILIFFFWIPAGRALLQYEYSNTFMMRFPVFYLAFFLLSALLETIRSVTQNELDKMREKYKYYAAHDYLTNLLNRQGLEEWYSSFDSLGEQAIMMIDIDHFKHVNDSYGHDIGDLVLASVAREIQRMTDTRVCRWGGEEFVVWFSDSDRMCDPETIRASIEKTDISIPNSGKVLHVTVSIGVTKGTGKLNTLVKDADCAMLQAKNEGRNRIRFFS
ncbi:MAG: GGDEF domain-containing protein [Anaerolineaceae bacterium]|nr:GGDEF domain-containing protein [Anaerolineaceae bacterium]